MLGNWGNQGFDMEDVMTYDFDGDINLKYSQSILYNGVLEG